MDYFCNFLTLELFLNMTISAQQEREIKEGGTAPRLLSLDDYFITEVEKVVEDPETGKKAKKMVGVDAPCYTFHYYLFF